MAVSDLLGSMAKSAVSTPDAIAQGADALDSTLKSIAILNKMAEDQALRPSREQAGIIQNLYAASDSEDRRKSLDAKINAMRLAEQRRFNPDGSLKTQAQIAIESLRDPRSAGDPYLSQMLYGSSQADAQRLARGLAGVNSPLGASIAQQYGVMPTGYAQGVAQLPRDEAALALSGALPEYLGRREMQQLTFDEAKRRQDAAFQQNREIAQIKAEQEKQYQDYKKLLEEKEREEKQLQEVEGFRKDVYKKNIENGMSPSDALKNANEVTLALYPAPTTQPQPQGQASSPAPSIVDDALKEVSNVESNNPPLGVAPVNRTNDPQSIYALLAKNPDLAAEIMRRNPAAISTIKPIPQPTVPGYGNVEQNILDILRKGKYGN